MESVIEIPNYDIINFIFHHKRTQVARAIHIPTSRKVVLKIIKSQFDEEDVKNFKKQFEIAKSFDTPFITKVYELYVGPKYIALVQEDDNSIDLSKMIPQEGFSVEIFLKIAIQIVHGLSVIHQKDIIHKDIKPSNFLYPMSNSGNIKFIDFGLSTLFVEGPKATDRNQKLEGTLSYISPEQTGRMNRTVDYRTDFYSLGVTFYQLLTGTLPFQKRDAMSLIHCHLAVDPKPVHLVKEGIPLTVSNIVSKLLMKNAEDRYQSSKGILYDLKRCAIHYNRILQQQFSSNSVSLTNTITFTFKTENPIIVNIDNFADFPICEQDCADRFQVSQKLYGREKEIEVMLDCYSRMSSALKNSETDEKILPEVMIVEGYAGIGKSTLINEVQRSISSDNGKFLSGKFDVLNRTVAYSGITQAFQGLIKQVLTQNTLKIQYWKVKLLEALKNNGQVIIDVIPQLQYIIGKQPPLIELDPLSAKNRFLNTFINFMSVFLKKEFPMVLFLDDLQWADAGSLELIKYTVTDPECQYLLFIGAYRDNEVNKDHPVIHILDEIKAAGNNYKKIALEPLDLSTRLIPMVKPI